MLFGGGPAEVFPFFLNFFFFVKSYRSCKKSISLVNKNTSIHKKTYQRRTSSLYSVDGVKKEELCGCLTLSEANGPSARVLAQMGSIVHNQAQYQKCPYRTIT